MFRFKLTKISNDSNFIDKFLKDNDLHYEPVLGLCIISKKIETFILKYLNFFQITDSEKQTIVDSLIEMGTSHSQVFNQNYYKVKYSI